MRQSEHKLVGVALEARGRHRLCDKTLDAPQLRLVHIVFQVHSTLQQSILVKFNSTSTLQVGVLYLEKL